MAKLSLRRIHLVHELPGRLRLRLWWLRDAPAEAAPLCDRLAQVPGVIEVRCRPCTGSVLFSYDPARTDAGRLLDAVRAATGVHVVIRPGEDDPAEDAALLRLAAEEGNDLARAAVILFRQINLDLLRFSEGRIDLGTLMALSFAVAGAAEVVVTRELPLPHWFNLAWWAYRTFTTLEWSTIDKVRRDSAPGGACPA